MHALPLEANQKSRKQENQKESPKKRLKLIVLISDHFIFISDIYVFFFKYFIINKCFFQMCDAFSRFSFFHTF